MIGWHGADRSGTRCRRQHRIQVVTFVLVAVAAFGCGGTAWAYWTSSGVGQGSAGTGFAAPLTLAPATAARTLYPGGVGDVSVVASNSATTPAVIASLALDPAQGTGGFAVDAGHQGCAVAALSFATQTNGGGGWTVPARASGADGVLAINLSDSLSMAADAVNACQGADITVFLAVAS